VVGYLLSNADNNHQQSTPFFVGANVVEFKKLQRIGLKPNGIDFWLSLWIFNQLPLSPVGGF
jgi:hypothetical protein